ncbi:Type II secretion system protein F [Novipirellula aureliae]|uniref:General secretion pathway protein F n=1 Tax=Novipirellula aureliae TaxID=2527966 RepID=A0A5C6EAI5_9BACT|nr:type II secretion system F family protein [Novipirellula aureliae]TWU46012.1 Type II secretion system protein F [Novipirellula aureliae]
MPDFAYVAKTATGERREGTIAAQTKRAAMQRLRQQMLYPVSVSDVKPMLGSGAGFELPQRIKKEQIADLCTQLADLLNNGVPMLESLSILADVTIHPRLQAAMRRIHDSVAEGSTLDQAMAAEPAIFSELTLSMVRAGQEGAFLEESLQRTSVFLNKQDEMRAKIIGALTYPLILGFVGTLITSLMMVFLVPKFQPFFDRLEATGSGLPMITILLLAVSHGLMNYGLLLPIPVVVIVFAVKKFIATDSGRLHWDTWKLKIPVMGNIFHDAAVSRACRVLGTLLRNGVPLLKSLKISSESTGNRVLQEVMMKSAENVTTGDTLAKPLAASGLIPPQIMAMIRIAEESNSLDDVLVKIADRIDNKVERQLEVMVRMIEPLMLVLIGGMVMFVIVGVLLPVFDLNATVN